MGDKEHFVHYHYMLVPENIVALIKKYQAGVATPEEKSILDEWYHSFEDANAGPILNDHLSEEHLRTRLKARINKTIHQKNIIGVSSQPRRIGLLAIAASLLIITISLYLLAGNNAPENNIVDLKPATPVDITPGGNKAVLTLEDGSIIILDSAANGMLSSQGNIKVIKLKNGELVYSINGKKISENDEAFYNTISTPRGGQYNVTLSDGTKVWLNAASSIKFPVAFTGGERIVEVTGETYFEVTKNAGKPFKVKVATTEIQVLGTHFNINSYEDEAALTTTLLEGKIKISSTSQSDLILKPGQQFSISKEGKIRVLNNADLEVVMAWKNGQFQFASADLQSILRQISRWYNVDIEYKGNVNLHFTGQLTRDVNVSKVLEMLKLTGEVKFKIDPNKIVVSR